MRTLSLVAALAGAGALVAAARPVTTLTFTVKTKQGPTSMHGRTFDSSLRLVNGAVPQLGRGPHAAVGAMQFSYTIRRQCAAFGKTCVATADFETVTTLPGGTVIANGTRVSIAKPTIVIPVVGGTGRYAGARGTVAISPVSLKLSTYRLILAKQ